MAMARELSKENLELVLMQAMMAAKNVRAQRDRLLELHRRLHRHRHQAAPDAEAELGQIDSDVFKVYYLGLDPGARMLWVCLDTAVKNRAVSAVNIAFALLPDDRLYDALLAQRLPARPTTQPQADLSDDPDATATAKPRHVASGEDVDKALDYLCRANRITSLAIKHIDVAVAVLSRFLDPKELARLADLTDSTVPPTSELRLASPILLHLIHHGTELKGSL